MSFLGFIVAIALFCHFGRRLRLYRAHEGGPVAPGRWAERIQREAERHARRAVRHAERHARRAHRHCGDWGAPWMPAAEGEPKRATESSPEAEALARARRRAAAEAGFYAHFMSY